VRHFFYSQLLFTVGKLVGIGLKRLFHCLFGIPLVYWARSAAKCPSGVGQYSSAESRELELWQRSTKEPSRFLYSFEAEGTSITTGRAFLLPGREKC